MSELWIGPCAHGHDPYERCDVCGEMFRAHAEVLADMVGARDATIARLERELAELERACSGDEREGIAVYRRQWKREIERRENAEADRDALDAELTAVKKERDFYDIQSQRVMIRAVKAEKECDELRAALERVRHLYEEAVSGFPTPFREAMLRDLSAALSPPAKESEWQKLVREGEEARRLPTKANEPKHGGAMTDEEFEESVRQLEAMPEGWPAEQLRALVLKAATRPLTPAEQMDLAQQMARSRAETSLLAVAILKHFSDTETEPPATIRRAIDFVKRIFGPH